MSIESLIPGRGEVSFLWFNRYSGVAIRTPTKVLVIDPAEVNPNVFREVDAVLISHEHYDHLDPSIVHEIHAKTGCVVIADPTSARRLRGRVSPDKLHSLAEGSELSLNGVRVRAEGARHPASTPITFLITTEDGIVIYHTADSLPFPGMRRIGEQSPPDIVFCTVGAPAPGASPRSGVEIVRMVRPKLAVPYHAPRPDAERFCEILSREMPEVRCLIMEQNKPYKYP